MREDVMNQIIEAVKAEIREKLGRECIVQQTTVNKNNDLVLTALLIQEFEENLNTRKMVPCVYIDQMLKEFETGSLSIQDFASEVTAQYRKNDTEFDISGIFNYRTILDCTVFQVINFEKNKTMLKNIPHKKFKDLAIVYRCILSEKGNGMVSFLVDNNVLKEFKLHILQLDAFAQTNSKQREFLTRPIASVLSELMEKTSDDILAEDIPKDYPPMYILSSPSGMYGAAVMLYPDYFKQLADRLGDDLYILPSSIHEVIAIPAEGLKLDNLKKMVQVVNKNHVQIHEVLSENVYKYQRQSDKLVIA